MTQEEINSSIQNIAFDANDKFRNKETVADDIQLLVTRTSQSISIAFGEWLLSNGCLPNETNWIRVGNKIHYTTAQLYDIYTASVNGKKEGI